MLIALLGEQAVLSTTLNALSSDQFEVINLAGKKLILVNDTSGEIKDTNMIKAYSGQDTLRGRRIHVQGTDDIVPEGIIFAVGNTPLTTMDTGSAISRRLRVFET